jgi:hypothetical protein
MVGPAPAAYAADYAVPAAARPGRVISTGTSSPAARLVPAHLWGTLPAPGKPSFRNDRPGGHVLTATTDIAPMPPAPPVQRGRVLSTSLVIRYIGLAILVIGVSFAGADMRGLAGRAGLRHRPRRRHRDVHGRHPASRPHPLSPGPPALSVGWRSSDTAGRIHRRAVESVGCPESSRGLAPGLPASGPPAYRRVLP